jgi:hypothetical protein
MSARRRIRTGWLAPREAPLPSESFKRLVREDANAAGALEKLVSKGMNEDALWRHLWGLAWLAKRAAQERISLNDLPGVPPHTLRRFPVKVRRMAEEIESLERKLLSNQFHALVSELLPLFLTKKSVADFSTRNGIELEDRQEQVSRLGKLPQSMRAYADDLATRLKVVARCAQMGEPLNRVMPLGLARTVEACTGKPHWDEIARLLTASYQAVGCDLEADPKALAMLRSRLHSKK